MERDALKRARKRDIETLREYAERVPKESRRSDLIDLEDWLYTKKQKHGDPKTGR